MKKIFMLGFANIRKAKGNTVSLFMMFLIASVLLNAGLLVSVNFASYFNKTVKELNASNTYYIMPSHLYNTEVESYIQNNDNVTQIQKENAVWMRASVPYNNDKRELFFLLNDADTKRSLSKWKFIGEHLLPDSMSVYLPYVFSVDGGYKLNDKFVMTFDDTVLTFTIKGFTDDVLFSSLDTGLLGAYLPHDTYQAVKQQIGNEYDATLIFANLKEYNKKVETGIKQITKQGDTVTTDMTNSVYSLGLPIIRLSRTMMASIVAVMVVLFAVIIAFVCLVVVRFRIINSVEEDMPKIGSLKAIGYTSGQIISSIVTQFSLIAIAGSVLGIALSYLTTPALSGVFAHQSGLKWVQGFDSVISSISLFAILFVVAFVSFIAARRIRKLNPIVALRGGITTHSFRKNHMPLHKSIGRLPVVLAIKSVLQNFKQSIMIGFILVAVAFCSTFAVVKFYNTEIDTSAFAKTPGMEISNVTAIFKPDADIKNITEEIRKISGVRKEQFIDEAAVKIEDNEASTYIMDDYSEKETNTVYDGRYPLHNNEIAIAGILANMLQKNIGDSVTLKIGDKKAEFIITGFTQGTSMGGMNASIRRDGIMRITPDFEQRTLNIYLNKGVKSDQFINKLKGLFKDSIAQTVDVDKLLVTGMGMYTSIVSKIGILMLTIVILVVILVLYFVINSSIIRRKREIGIQKAIGFTTLQLMNQISLGFLPPVITGTLIGIILGMTQTNPLMSLAQHSMGIMKANFIIDVGWITIFGIGIAIISYLTSMLITYRIREITAYTLISE